MVIKQVSVMPQMGRNVTVEWFIHWAGETKVMSLSSRKVLWSVTSMESNYYYTLKIYDLCKFRDKEKLGSL